MANKVFCGGLAWATDDLGLQMAMTDFGPVDEVKIVMDRDTNKSKGFGFVTFKEAAGAEAAIKAALGMLTLPDPIAAGVIDSGFEKLGIAFSHAEAAARLPLPSLLKY